VAATTIWLRSPRFDGWMQAGALACIAPALAIHAAVDPARAASWLPLASLIAIPFLHVFGSFFFAFSPERNQSPSPPFLLAVQWALWVAAAAALSITAPRALATFALLYGGWHILRQNFGFLREVAHRAGRAHDRTLRGLDLAACLAPAVALWLFVAARGPWRFVAADVYHPPVPRLLLVLAFIAVPLTVALRQRHLGLRSPTLRADLLLLAGNCAALLGPALLLSDLTFIYTLSASYHGFQYLAYLVERERERHPEQHANGVLLPLASAITLSMAALFGALTLVAWLFSPEWANQLLLVLWYAIVPFHYFVDGRIWRRRLPQKAPRVSKLLMARTLTVLIGSLLVAGAAHATEPLGFPTPAGWTDDAAEAKSRQVDAYAADLRTQPAAEMVAVHLSRPVPYDEPFARGFVKGLKRTQPTATEVRHEFVQIAGLRGLRFIVDITQDGEMFRQAYYVLPAGPVTAVLTFTVQRDGFAARLPQFDTIAKSTRGLEPSKPVP
jgi:hypothetical protein